MEFSLGIDFGTSGARAIVLNAEGGQLAEAHYTFRLDCGQGSQSCQQWQTALFSLLAQLPRAVRSCIQRIAIAGTSSTVLLCDQRGQPIAEPLLYHDARATAMVEPLRQIAPPGHTVLNATSSLAKFLWLRQHADEPVARYFLHQADWLAGLLHGQWGISDYHNSLKLGYDVERLAYPDWLADLPGRSRFPQVVAPGTVIGVVTRDIVDRCHFSPHCQVCAGTTDSIAAFLASGVTVPGAAVTSLGSTLVIKLLSRTRLDDAHYGIYSHRLGELWLVGGASNTGGAVLRQFFSDAELAQLSQQIDPTIASPLAYYPLVQKGDRFPVNDPDLLPQMEPRPEDPVAFLHGLLEGIARIEATAYRLLQDRGTTPLTQVYTAGGGAKNLTWMAMRQRHLRVPVRAAQQTQAAYGVAMLAQRGM
jgi:D-ribulokinase